MQDPGQEDPGCLGEILLSPTPADSKQTTAGIVPRFFQIVFDSWEEAVLPCRHPRYEIVQHLAQPIEVFLTNILAGRDERQHAAKGFPEYGMTVAQAIKPIQSVSPNAHGKQGRSVGLYGEAFHLGSAFAIRLAGRMAGGCRLLVRESASDSQFDRHLPGGAQNFRHSTREPVGVQFEDEFHLSVPITFVHVLPETSEIDRVTADSGSPRIEITGFDRVVGKRQGVQNA